MVNKNTAEDFANRAEWYRNEYGKDRGELVLAVELNYLEKVKELVTKGVDVNGLNVCNVHTLLSHHVYNLTMYAEVYAKDRDYAYRRDRITELLLKAGANPNGVSSNLYTPLMNACWGFLEGPGGEAWREKYMWVLERIVKQLVEAGADPNLNQRDIYGRTLYGIFPKIKDLIWKPANQKKLLWIIEDNHNAIKKMAKRLCRLFDAILVSDWTLETHDTEGGITVHNEQDTLNAMSNMDFGKIVVLVDMALTKGKGTEFLVRTMAGSTRNVDLCLVYNSAIRPGVTIPIGAIRDAQTGDWNSLGQFYLQPGLHVESELITEFHRTAAAIGKAIQGPVVWAGDLDDNLLVPQKNFDGSEKGVANYETIRRIALGLGKANIPECLQRQLMLDDLYDIAKGRQPTRRIAHVEELIRGEAEAVDVLFCEAPLPDAVMMRAIDLCTKGYGAPDAGIAILARNGKALSDNVMLRVLEELVRMRETSALRDLAERKDLTKPVQDALEKCGLAARYDGESLDASKLVKRPASVKPRLEKDEAKLKR